MANRLVRNLQTLVQATLANSSINATTQSTLEDEEDWRQRRCGPMPAARMREQVFDFIISSKLNGSWGKEESLNC